MPDDLFWTYPLRLEINEDGKTVCDLLDEYKHFLDANQPEHSNSFDQRCNNQPEAARSEAVVFSFFKWNGYDIRVEETGKGGVDFRAQKDDTEIELLPSVPFVEVLVPEIEDYSAGDSYRIRTRWLPDNLPDGAFI